MNRIHHTSAFYVGIYAWLIAGCACFASTARCDLPTTWVPTMATLAVGSPGSNEFPQPVQQAPWYDAQRGETRPVRVAPPVRPQTPREWTWDFASENSRQGRNRNRLPGTDDGMGWGLGSYLGYALVVLALGMVVVGCLVYFQLLDFAPSRPIEETGEASAVFLSLPHTLPKGTTDLLAEARSCYERGDLGAAIVYLYSYQLVQLDKHGWLHLTRGKTNRQYLREISRHPPLHQALQSTARLFEAFFFGQHLPNAQHFEACWRQLDDFNQRVAARPTAQR